MPWNLLAAAVPYLAVTLGLLVFCNAWLAILTYHAGMAIVILSTRAPLPLNSDRKAKRHDMIIPLVIGASGGLVLYLLRPWLSIPPDIGSYMRSIGLTPATWPYFVAYYVITNPFLEEYYWRSRLGNNTRRPVLNDFLFAGYHLLVLNGKIGVIWMVVVFAILSASAWYWRQVTRITGGVRIAVLSHMAADITVILAIYLLTA